MNHRGYKRDPDREREIEKTLRRLEAEAGIVNPKRDPAARLFELLRSPGYARIADIPRYAGVAWDAVVETAIKACVLGQMTEGQRDFLIAEATKLMPKREREKKTGQKHRTAQSTSSKTSSPPPPKQAPPPRQTHGWGWDKDQTARVPGKEWVPPKFDAEEYRREQKEKFRREQEERERRRQEEARKKREQEQEQRRQEQAWEAKRKRAEQRGEEEYHRRHAPPPPGETSSSHRRGPVPPYVRNLDLRRDRAFKRACGMFRLTMASDRAEAENALRRIMELCEKYRFTMEQIETTVNKSERDKELWNWIYS